MIKIGFFKDVGKRYEEKKKAASQTYAGETLQEGAELFKGVVKDVAGPQKKRKKKGPEFAFGGGSAFDPGW